TLTAFGATAGQYGTAVFGSHASTETVGAGALDGAGLESAFHGQLPGGHYLVKWRPREPPFKETGDCRERQGAGQFPTSSLFNLCVAPCAVGQSAKNNQRRNLEKD